MIEKWIQEIKTTCAPDQLGMILVHNGIVRGTAKDGKSVQGMILSYDEGLLEQTLAKFRNMDGIVAVRAWINKGELQIGDDIMYVLVAGRFRTDVLPVFQDLIRTIKNEIVKEEER
ncbi:MAG: MoaE protein [Syntrophorhabdus sp. PtaU1.Bin050]|nr:MAG: MoaE protein [Syntrophorhabdus sp. PtaU1.Bin050]